MSPRDAPLLTAQQAARLVPHRAFDPVHALFARLTPDLRAALSPGFPAWDHPVRQENPDNVGVYFWRHDAPVPFLWLGLGWGLDDPPERLPSWGASLEVNRGWVAGFQRGDAGLRAACEVADRAGPRRLGLHAFEAHVELAEWRPMQWLLEQSDQRAALLGFWRSYLGHLADAGVPAAAEAFAGRIAE